MTHSTSEACISFRKSLENVRSLTSAVLEQSKSPSGGSKLRWLDKQRSPSSDVEDPRPSPKDLASSRSSTSMYSARSSPPTPEFESPPEPAVFHPPPELAPFDPPPPQPRSNQGFGVVFFRAGALGQLESQRDERLQDHVTRLQARCRGYLARRRFAKRKVQEVAVQCIQRNVRRFLQVRDWPWWRLLVRVAPLLNVHRAEEELKTKTEELETLRARLEKVETERTRLKQDTDRLEARIRFDGVKPITSLGGGRRVAGEEQPLMALGQQICRVSRVQRSTRADHGSGAPARDRATHTALRGRRRIRRPSVRDLRRRDVFPDAQSLAQGVSARASQCGAFATQLRVCQPEQAHRKVPQQIRGVAERSLVLARVVVRLLQGYLGRR
ncbi:hypothetical protein B566_EDAN009952 [Ephemera danica]|nr:hypothetical protein B566_EDAN009952 [Ephemera danica]